MALDPNIVLSAGKSSQQNDPLQSVNNALAIRSQLINQRSAVEDRQRNDLLRQATVIGPDGQVDEATTIANIQGLVGPDAAAALQHKFSSNRLARGKAENENKKAELERSEKNMQMFGEALSSLGPNPPLDALYRKAQSLREQGMQIRLDELPESQEEVGSFMQQMNAQAMGIAKQLEQRRADFTAAVTASQPLDPAARAAYDWVRYQQSGFPDFSHQVPSQFGALQQPGAPIPIGAPANALEGSPQGANVAAAPGGIEIAAPPVTTTDVGQHLRINMLNKNLGEIGPFRYGPDGSIIANPEFQKFALEKADKSSMKVINPPYEKERDKQLAIANSKLQDEARIQASTARQVNLIVDILAKYPGGPTEGMFQEINQFAPWAKGITTANDLANAIRDRLGPSMRVLGSGSTSDFEAKKALSALPSLSMYAEGRAILAKVFDTIAERTAVEADIRDEIASSGDSRNMEQRVAKAMRERFPDKQSLLSKEELQQVNEAIAGGRKAGKHNVQTPPSKTIKFEDLK